MLQNKVPNIRRVVTLLALTPAAATASDLTLTFIQVGEGDAMLISADDRHILFDGGMRRYDVADHPRGEGIGHIDWLVATHPHADHIGGQVEVLERKPVGTIWYSGDEHTTQTFQAWIDAALEADADYREPVRGESWEAGDLAVKLLHPLRRRPAANSTTATWWCESLSAVTVRRSSPATSRGAGRQRSRMLAWRRTPMS